ncbi:MAG TPA: PAS domain S-box protein [Geomonas sp.]
MSLKTKMTVAVSLLTAVLLSILAFSAQVYFVDQIKAMISSQQFTMVSVLAEQVDDKLLLTQNELVAAASTMDRAVLKDPARLRKFFADRPDTLAMFDNGLFLFSPEGTLLSGNHSKPDLLGKNFSHRDYLKKTLATRRAQISEPFLSAQAHKHPIVMFTAPVFDEQGAIIAILGGSLDLAKNNFLTKLASIKLGERGYLYLYNSSRTMIVHKDRDRVFTQDIPPGANLLYDKAISGFEGTGETVTSRHLHAISSFKRLKSTGWILASNFPQSEAYAPVYRTQRHLLMALLTVFLASFLVVWLSMKYLTAPLISFTRQIRELTLGNSTQTRVRIEARDEIGTLGDAFNLLLEELDGQKKGLKKQLDFSQMLIDSIPIPVFYKDTQGKYLGCNKAFEESSGFSKQQLIGKTVFDIAPIHLAGIYHQADQDLLLETDMQIYESEADWADGSRRSVVFFKTAIPGADEAHGGVIGAMLDITDRKRAASALAAQKEFAESLVQNSVLPTFVLDDKHRVIIWNRACEMLTGIDAAGLLGSDQLWRVFYDQERPLLADLLVDGNLDVLPDYYESHTHSGLTPEGVQTEGWFRDQHGIGHYVTLNAAPIRDSQGGLVAVIQTVQDITERRLAQDAHDKTRRELQLILDAAGEGIYGVDLEGRVTFANPAAAQMTGWYQEDLLGKRQHSLLHHTRSDGTPYPADECPIYAAFSDGMTRQVNDEVFWRKDGTSFPVEYVSTPIREAGALVGAVVIFKDTTERKLTEDQLLKLSQAVMQSPVPIVITDPSGTIEFVNPKFTQASGYESDEMIGRNPSLLKGGKTPPEVYKSLWSTISAGRVWSGELHNRQKNGDLYWVHATISPIRNSSGVISHYMAFAESMTERKKLEEQLRQAQKMEAIGQLAGGVAHDFNNILTVIMGFGQLLQHSLPADDPKRSHMVQILDAADRATHLTRSLLAFSRKQVMMLQQVELNELAQKHTRFLVRIIGEDVTLQTGFAEEPLPVLADSGQIEQVLMNLATNARDAMPGGGELCIRTEPVLLDKEFYRQHGYGVPGRYALVTISDNGAGMDAETQAKVFEPFFTTKPPGRGTGLGLSIVYGIVKQHGGYITMVSECGVGTTFSIYLPLTAASPEETAEKAPAVAPRGGQETILVVEDDPMVRHLVDSVLKSFGYSVILAESGEEALEMFEANWRTIDLALLDVIMPRMNGRQVCEALRQRSPQLKVLFLTGYTADLIQDKGILVDGIDLLLKPAQPAELAKKVREMLDARQSRYI